MAKEGLVGSYLTLQSCSSERRACAVGGGEVGGAARIADCMCVCVRVCAQYMYAQVYKYDKRV